MCNECYQNPCHPQCPNAPEPPIVYYCSNCNDPIYHGEDYYDIGGEKFCEICVKDNKKVAEFDGYEQWDEE